MYEIERNIPIPEPRGSKAKYPFREMEVGDSIFIIAPVSYSEVYSAVRLGRKGIGIELKPTYYRQAQKNLESLKNQTGEQNSLFSVTADAS